LKLGFLKWCYQASNPRLCKTSFIAFRRGVSNSGR
jgi:hypothetical protein